MSATAAVVVVSACDVIENVSLLRTLANHPSWTRPFTAVKFAVAKPLAVLALLTVIVLIVSVLSSHQVRHGWFTDHAGLGRWLTGVPPTFQPLTGWLPSGGTQPDPPESIAICSSGGGIRSASFNLGALQVFMREGIYQKAKVVTAVSGGCYVAAAVAITRSHSDVGALTAALPAFAPGSPEENRLRTHMRYLAPDGRGIAIGALALLFGFVTNLGTVLASCYVGARVLGWTMHAWKVLVPPGYGEAAAGFHVPPAVPWLVAVLLLGGIGVYAAERFAAVYWLPGQPVVEGMRTWALRLLASGLITSALLVGLPAMLAGLFNLGTSNRPTAGVARVLAAAGFTTDKGCAAAAEAARAKALTTAIGAVPQPATFEYGACGQTFTGRIEGSKAPDANITFDEHGGGPAGTVAGALAALLALIKTTAGRVGAKASKTGADDDGQLSPAGTTLKTRAAALLRRAIAPWAGTVLAIGLICLVSLRVAEDAMLGGITPSGLVGVLAVSVTLLLLPFVTDATRTSLHPMYRERLASVFAVKRTSDGHAEQVPYAQPLSFSELNEPTLADDSVTGGPELVICATANVDDVGLAPPGRGGVPFVFSRKIVGITASEGIVTTPSLKVPTANYEQAAAKRLLTVPGAVAISGAAVSPVMGRMTRAPVRFLLGIANVRLGVWLLNPARVGTTATPTAGGAPGAWARAFAQWKSPGVTCLLREMIGRNSIRRKYLYVTDGGHYDNYGLLEALRRRSTMIYVIDGTGDTPPVWTTLGHAISLARADLGVEIELDALPPEPDDDGVVETNVVTCTVVYPDGIKGRLVIGKLARPQFATYDIVTYGHEDRSFPNKSTADQLYGDIEFESYRKLGALTAAVMVGDS
jgi:hypothetical protein